jgi:hypothetical protein
MKVRERIDDILTHLKPEDGPLPMIEPRITKALCALADEIDRVEASIGVTVKKIDPKDI